MKTIFGEHEVEEYKLTDEDWKNIEALSNEIPYMGLELRAKSKYNFERDEKFEKGFVQIKFDVKRQN